MPTRTSVDVSSLIGARPGMKTPRSIVSAYVSVERPAPSAFGDPVYVVVPSHSTEMSTQMTWADINQGAVPAQADPCLVAYDETGSATLIWWRPAALA